MVEYDFNLEYVASSVFRFADNVEMANQYFNEIMDKQDLLI